MYGVKGLRAEKLQAHPGLRGVATSFSQHFFPLSSPIFTGKYGTVDPKYFGRMSQRRRHFELDLLLTNINDKLNH
jgi:hypothetical protein